jgi:hypothetical protein
VNAPIRQLADPTSVIGRRIGAWTIDLAIFLALVAAVLFATGGVSWRTETYESFRQATDACEPFQDEGAGRFCSVSGEQAIFVEVEGSTNGVWLVHALAYILIQGITGGSIGKLLVGLRVVDEHGQVIGLSKSFLRTSLWVADAITCALPIVGGVMIVSTKGHRRVGDIVAGTFVVRQRDVGQPIGALVTGYAAPPPPGPWAATGVPPAWGEPSSTDPTPGDQPSLEGARAEAPSHDGPIWDDARDTYIQYDRHREEWLQWDPRGHEWKPIDR